MANETVKEIREVIDTNANFDKIVKRANEIQEKCADYTVPANKIHMDEELRLNFDDKSMMLSDFATSGMCGKLKVPSQYFSRLVNENRKALAADNINTWLEDSNKEYFIREYDGRIRGFLTGNYSVYDAPEILQSIDEAFDMTKFNVKGSFVNEERLHIRLAEKEMLDIDGEDLFAGISIDSSDVGRSGLRVNFFIYKQVCTNGLVIAKSSAQLFKQKHVGISHSEFVAGLKEGLNTFYELKEKVAESIRETSKIPVKEDIDELLEDIKKSTGLSQEACEEVVYLMDNSYKRNRWGLINGITEVAQKYTLDRRIELETIAGNMLENIA